MALEVLEEKHPQVDLESLVVQMGLVVQKDLEDHKDLVDLVDPKVLYHLVAQEVPKVLVALEGLEDLMVPHHLVVLGNLVDLKDREALVGLVGQVGLVVQEGLAVQQFQVVQEGRVTLVVLEVPMDQVDLEVRGAQGVLVDQVVPGDQEDQEGLLAQVVLVVPEVLELLEGLEDRMA